MNLVHLQKNSDKGETRKGGVFESRKLSTNLGPGGGGKKEKGDGFRKKQRKKKRKNCS